MTRRTPFVIDAGRVACVEMKPLMAAHQASGRCMVEATVTEIATARAAIEMLWGGGEEIVSIVADVSRWRAPVQKPSDLNQSRIVLKQDSTLIAVIEMSLRSWLVAGIVPGVDRQPLKKLAIDESALLMLLNR